MMSRWPAFRQLTGRDRLGRGVAARSPHTEAAAPRTAAADRVVGSVCPYCAVGCGQKVYVSVTGGKERVTQIEGDPDSPVSRGRLCPKGCGQQAAGDRAGRQTKVLYRRPYGRAWEPLEPRPGDGHDRRPAAGGPARGLAGAVRTGSTVRRTLGIASLGGATLDNEENYLIKKLWTALGAIQIENQARI